MKAVGLGLKQRLEHRKGGAVAREMVQEHPAVGVASMQKFLGEVNRLWLGRWLGISQS